MTFKVVEIRRKKKSSIFQFIFIDIVFVFLKIVMKNCRYIPQ